MSRLRLAIQKRRVLFARPNLLLSNALARSHVYEEPAHELAEVRKAHNKARIDVLSAGLLAVGARDSRPPKRNPSIRIVGRS